MSPTRLVAGLAVWFAQQTTAAIITVDDDGPADHATIQAAIDAASDGDTIFIAPGTYVGAEGTDAVATLTGKSLTIRSFSGAASTIVDGGNRRRGLACVGGETDGTTIEGLTFTGGRRSPGAGASAIDATVDFIACVFLDNNGEGLYLEGSDATVDGCRFEGNRDTNGGGLQAIGGAPTIVNCEFIENTAIADGGGASLTGCEGSITDCTFRLNVSGLSAGAGRGGGLALIGSTTTVRSNRFVSNQATEEGGGLYWSLSDSGTTVSLEDCDFEGNVAQNGSSAAALILAENSLTVTQCVVIGNQSGDSSGGGSLLARAAQVAVVDCRFAGNGPIAGTNGIGGLFVATESGDVRDTIFENNVNGSLFVFGSEDTAVTTISDCSFQGSSGRYGSVYAYGSGQTTIERCEMTGVTPPDAIIFNISVVDSWGTNQVLVRDSTFFGNNAPVLGMRGSTSIRVQDTVICALGSSLIDDYSVREYEDLGGNCILGDCTDADEDGVPDGCLGRTDLQAQLESAEVGDVIELPAATYRITRSLNPLGKALTVRGAVDVDGTPLTVIDGLDAMQLLRCVTNETETTVFENLVFTNGRGDLGGGLWIDSDASPTFRNCRVSDCTATTRRSIGAGVYVTEEASPTLENVRLCDNVPAPISGPWTDLGGNCLGDCADDDDDGVLNCNDDCPDDPGQSSDVDTDGDGVVDCADACPTDPFKLEPGLCGCGIPDTDLDGDGLICDDPCPTWAGDCSEDGRTLYVEVGESVADAVAGASSGSTVLLRAGVHTITETISITTAGVVLRGETDVSGTPLTTLDGQGSRRVITAVGVGRGTVLADLAITNGVAADGGGLYLEDASPVVRNVRFEGNVASTDGGGLYATAGSNPLLDRCRFLGNTAPFGAGAHFVEATAEVVDCVFDANVASGSGGGLRFFEGGASTIRTSTFRNNQADYGGGLDLWETTTLVEDCVFRENEVINAGGGLGMYLADLVVRRTTFDHNLASFGGGVRTISGETADATFESCTFLDNVATGSGGGVYSAGDTSQLVLNDCIFEGNHANDGGGLYANSYYNQTTERRLETRLSNCAFRENLATATLTGESYVDTRGGAIRGFAIAATIVDCEFTDNRANITVDLVSDAYTTGYAFGGAIYCSSCGDTEQAAVIRDCVFTDNEATGSVVHTHSPGSFITRGGGFYGTGGRLELDGLTCSANQAGSGGWGYFALSELTITKSAFDANAATSSGGALYLVWYGTADLDAAMHTCTFTNNTSEIRGGALYISGWYYLDEEETDPWIRVTATDCVFTGNRSGGGIYPGLGGAAYLTVDEIGIDAAFVGCTFESNVTEGGQGGAILGYGEAGTITLRTTIDSCTIRNNVADSGGGLWIDSNALCGATATRICDNGADQIAGPFEDAGDNCISTTCDADADGTLDCDDGCPEDPDKTEPGDCGCGVADLDTDEDGVADCIDGCPNDPAKTEPGACGCGVADADTDEDGVVDCLDGCPNDPAKTDPGVCGCGVPDTDTDDDGVADCIDQCPGSPDLDTDGDGLADCVDPCPTWPGVCSEDGLVIEVDPADPGQPIALAFDLVPAGGTMRLGAGVHAADRTLDPAGRAFLVEGPVDAEGRPLATIDAGRLQRVLQCVSGETPSTRFENLRLVGGAAADGAGLLIEDASPTFLNCWFEGNVATDQGGGLQISGGEPSLDRCRFLGNTATTGGGAAVRLFATAVFDACVFEDNEATTGGGVAISFGAAVTMRDGVVDGNQASGGLGGGGVWVSTDTGGVLSIEDTLVCENLPDQIEGPFEDLGGNTICPNPCPADLDGDGIVDAADLGQLFIQWGPCPDCPADLDGDGDVDGADLGGFFLAWGSCP